MRSSAFWHVVPRRLVVTDVSGQSIRTIFSGQAVHEVQWTLEDGSDRFSRNVGTFLLYVTCHKTEYLIFTAEEDPYRVGFESDVLAGHIQQEPEDAGSRPGLPARHQMDSRLHSWLQIKRMQPSNMSLSVSEKKRKHANVLNVVLCDFIKGLQNIGIYPPGHISLFMEIGDLLYFPQTSTITTCPIESSPLHHISLSPLCYHLYLDLQNNSAS